MSERAARSGGSSPVLVALIAGVCSGVAAAVVVRLVEGGPAASGPGDASPARGPDPSQLEALRQDVAALRAEIAQLRLPEVHRRPEPISAPATAAPERAPPSPELVALTAAVERLTARLGDDSLQIATPVVDLERRRALAGWPDLEDEPPRVEWFLWTPQQLLDAYGAPDEIYHSQNGLTKWQYLVGTRTDEEGEVDELWVTFSLSGGRVFRVD